MVRSPNKVTSKSAVEKAIARANELGREEFRLAYGYGESRTYFLRHNGKTYDSKAIVGVAFGYQFNTEPLQYDDFSGGAATVAPVLKGLGYTVIASNLIDGAPTYPSEWLEFGEIYTRKNLREIFGITDATLDNGVFRLKGSKSIWLFVTEEKTKDRPQLVDKLDGDMLAWQGQPAGRTDNAVIDHLSNGDELLVFYRKKRDEFPNGGFRYEGPFTYRAHTGAKPTSFILDRDGMASAPSQGRSSTSNGDQFNPKNVADGRAQVLALVRRRQGQPKFRAALLKAYNGKCAISGCDFKPLLEAAHIYPYRGNETNHITNGILLRSDLHTLFDLGLIAIRGDGSLDVCDSLKGTEYADWKSCSFPARKAQQPSIEALEWHRQKIATPAARKSLIKKLFKEQS